MKNENKEEFATGGTFCTFELIVSQNALSKVHLRNYGSYFKVLLILSDDINLNPGPPTQKRNDMLWELLPFHNWGFPTQSIDYQLDSLPEISNGVWNIF